MKLREWQYMNKPTGNTVNNSSVSYKKRFEKLIKYHIDHASSELESITKKDIRDSYFRLGEHYNDGREEFDRDIVVSYDKDSDTFLFRIFVDGKEAESILRKGYENFVAAIEAYMFLPDDGTQEYDDLLIEWVAMKNSNISSQPVSSSSSTFYKDKFKKLLDYHMAHASYTLSMSIDKLSEDDHKASFSYVEEYDNGKGKIHESLLGVRYYKDTEAWSIKYYVNGIEVQTKEGISFNDLIFNLQAYMEMPLYNSTEYKNLCESFSAADDFKLYENLWD